MAAGGEEEGGVGGRSEGERQRQRQLGGWLVFRLALHGAEDRNKTATAPGGSRNDERTPVVLNT
eukprot:1184239-Prorocentrum_minimum.AAC.2